MTIALKNEGVREHDTYGSTYGANILSVEAFKEIEHEQKIDAELAAIKAKYDPKNDKTTEIERILYGDGQYWNRKARDHALEQYANSDYMLSDIEKLKNEGKYEEIKGMIKKYSKKYKAETVKSLETTLDLMYKTANKIEESNEVLKYLTQTSYFKFPEYKSNEEQEKNDMQNKIATETLKKVAYKRVNKPRADFIIYQDRNVFAPFEFKWLEKFEEYSNRVFAPLSFTSIKHGFGKLFTYLEHNGLGNKPASEYMQVKSQKLEFKQRQRKPEIAMQKPVKAERKITPKVIPDNIVSLSKERAKRNPSYFTAGKRIAAGIAAAIGFLWNTPSYAPENKPENKNERVEVSQRDNFFVIDNSKYNPIFSYDYTSNLIDENTSSNILSLEYILGEERY